MIDIQNLKKKTINEHNILIQILDSIEKISEIYNIYSVSIIQNHDLLPGHKYEFDFGVEVNLNKDENNGCVIGFNEINCCLVVYYCYTTNFLDVESKIYNRKFKIKNLDQILLKCFQKYKFLTKDEQIIKDIIK